MRREFRSALPVTFDADMIGGLASGRVRALAVPVGVFGQRRAGALLWVRETVLVDELQTQPDELWIRYTGAGRSVPVPWPADQPKPRGRRGALGMPIECSRFTLVVESVEKVRLDDLTDADAVACGLEAVEGGGWAPWYAGEAFMPYTSRSEALRGLLATGLGVGWTEIKRKVAFVRFEAVARSIFRMGGHQLVGARP